MRRRRLLFSVATGAAALSLALTGTTGTARADTPAAPPAPAAGSTVPLLGADASQPPVAVPGVPTVDQSITENQDPKVLLAHAISLLTAGSQAGSLQANLSTTQAQADADSVAANQAQAAASAANAQAAKASAAAQAAAQAAEDATNRSKADHDSAQRLGANTKSLSAALKQAALDLYMNGGTPTPKVPLEATQTDGDAAIDAMVGEQIALSPQGILAAQKRSAAQAVVTANAASADVPAAAKAAATARQTAAAATAAAATAKTASTNAANALAASNAQVASIHQQLSSVSASDATLLNGEATSVATQAGKDLTSGVSLQFTPASPLPASVPTTTVALAWAFSQLGKTYVWGGTGPDVFDCSGLTQNSWGHANISIPRVAADQYTYTVPVPLSNLRPGDLVFFGTDVHHVGMYIGNGLMINSPHTGSVVSITDIWWSDLIGFGRVHTATTSVPAHTPPQTAGSVGNGSGGVPSQTTPPPGQSPITEPGSGSTSTTAPSSGSSSTTDPSSTSSPTS